MMFFFKYIKFNSVICKLNVYEDIDIFDTNIHIFSVKVQQL